MRAADAEAVALRALESARGARAYEDHRIEYKAQLIPAEKFARRLAAHANCARGETIVWLLGYDEKTGATWDGPTQDINDWWPGVQACFEGAVAPDLLTSVARISSELPITVLAFGTGRAPYVVKRGTSGDDFDVPFRDGPRTRSAKRHELLSIITPTVSGPSIEALGAAVSIYQGVLEACLDLYIVPAMWNPMSGAPMLTFALHRSRLALEPPDASLVPIEFQNLTFVTTHTWPGSRESEAPLSRNGVLLIPNAARVRLRGTTAVTHLWAAGRLRALLSVDNGPPAPSAVTIDVEQCKPALHGTQVKMALIGGMTVPIPTPPQNR